MKSIFCHGLGQTPDSWNRTLSQLRNYENNICPNLAELVRNQEVTYNSLYNAFSAICNEINEPLNLCGLSLGAVLALNYAIDNPTEVHSLVLIAAQYKMPRNLLRFQNAIFRFMPQSMFQQMGFGKSDFLSLCKTMKELDFSDSLHKISCPMLIICGEKDNANKKASINLAHALEKARLEIVQDCDHEVNMEAPEKLAKLLEEFFR